MTTAKVRADHEQLAQIAKAFGRQADGTQHMLGALQKNVSTLQGGEWVGKGADKFYQEMNSSVLPSIKRVVAAMNSAANTTTKISRVMKQAEDEAAALFRLAGAGTGTQVGDTGALDGVQAGNVSAFRRPGPDGGGSGASGGGAPAPAKPKGQPGTKDKPPRGSDRFQGTDAQYDFIRNKNREIGRKFAREQVAAAKKVTDKLSDRLELKMKIARLQGKPEYKVRRAEFLESEKSWITEIDKEYQQTVRNVTGAKRAYEAAKEALAAKPPEQVTLDDIANVEILKRKAAFMEGTILRAMNHYHDAYFNSGPRLPP